LRLTLDVYLNYVFAKTKTNMNGIVLRPVAIIKVERLEVKKMVMPGLNILKKKL
jgi:hypothetical protein